jgi:hypothetical protein
MANNHLATFDLDQCRFATHFRSGSKSGFEKANRAAVSLSTAEIAYPACDVR